MCHNARPHTTSGTKPPFLLWIVLRLLPYGPDMTKSNIHLFRSPQHFLTEKWFNDAEEVKTYLYHYFTSKSWDFLFFRYAHT